MQHVRQKLLETGGVLTLNSYRPLQKLQGPREVSTEAPTPENEIKWDITFMYNSVLRAVIIDKFLKNFL